MVLFLLTIMSSVPLCCFCKGSPNGKLILLLRVDIVEELTGLNLISSTFLVAALNDLFGHYVEAWKSWYLDLTRETSS